MVRNYVIIIFLREVKGTGGGWVHGWVSRWAFEESGFERNPEAMGKGPPEFDLNVSCLLHA